MLSDAYLWLLSELGKHIFRGSRASLAGMQAAREAPSAHGTRGEARCQWLHLPFPLWSFLNLRGPGKMQWEERPTGAALHPRHSWLAHREAQDIGHEPGGKAVMGIRRRGTGNRPDFTILPPRARVWRGWP
jgi:hypothetical protein